METIDQVALGRFGSLLDAREQAVVVVAGTYKHSRNSNDPIPIALMVTDQRIVVGGDDGTMSVYAYRNRRHRLQPSPTESSVIKGSLDCGGLTHMFFPLASRDLLEQVDMDAAEWDQIDGGQLGALTADDGGAYRLVKPPSIFPSFAVDFDGSMPVDVMAWTAQFVGDAERYLADALVAVVAEFLPLKNNNWLSDGEAPLSEAEFRRRLKLASAEVATAESAEFFFHDDGMFGHHSVVVTTFDRCATWSLNLFG